MPAQRHPRRDNESCPTKIFLANPYAEQKEAAELPPTWA